MMRQEQFGLPPAPTTTCDHFTATVIFEYVWTMNDLDRQTSTYTTTYINNPPHQTLFAIINNEHVPRPSQTQVVAVPMTTVTSGGTYTADVPATIATHRPTASVSRTPDVNETTMTQADSVSSPGVSEPGRALDHLPSLPVDGLPAKLFACQMVMVILLFYMMVAKWRAYILLKRTTTAGRKTEFEA